MICPSREVHREECHAKVVVYQWRNEETWWEASPLHGVLPWRLLSLPHHPNAHLAFPSRSPLHRSMWAPWTILVSLSHYLSNWIATCSSRDHRHFQSGSYKKKAVYDPAPLVIYPYWFNLRFRRSIGLLCRFHFGSIQIILEDFSPVQVFRALFPDGFT